MRKAPDTLGRIITVSVIFITITMTIAITIAKLERSQGGLARALARGLGNAWDRLAEAGRRGPTGSESPSGGAAEWGT